MSDEPLSRHAKRLLIPTNPAIDIASVAPTEFEYANPVTLNNLLLLYGNARIELADRAESGHKRLERAKLQLREATRDVEGFERQLLRNHPVPKGCTTLKHLSAHMEQSAVLDNLGDQYDELRKHEAVTDDEVHAAQSQLTRYKDWNDTIEAAVTSITVHLSYVKAEWMHAGRK